MTQPTTPPPEHPAAGAAWPTVPTQAGAAYPPPAPGYAAPPHAGYAAPPPVGYAPPPHAGYAAPPPVGYAPPPHAGYGSPPAPPHWHPTAPNGAPLADFGQRLAAYLIDGLIVSAAWILIVVIAAVPSIMFLDQRGASDAAFALGIFGLWGSGVLVLFAAYYVYMVEMMFRTGQTVGKRIMKIRIVPVDPGATLTRAMAARRWLVEIPGGVLLSCVAFAYIDGLWQLWDRPYRQCLHDKYAKTAVVKVTV